MRKQTNDFSTKFGNQESLPLEYKEGAATLKSSFMALDGKIEVKKYSIQVVEINTDFDRMRLDQISDRVSELNTAEKKRLSVGSHSLQELLKIDPLMRFPAIN